MSMLLIPRNYKYVRFHGNGVFADAIEVANLKIEKKYCPGLSLLFNLIKWTLESRRLTRSWRREVEEIREIRSTERIWPTFVGFKDEESHEPGKNVGSLWSWERPPDNSHWEHGELSPTTASSQIVRTIWMHLEADSPPGPPDRIAGQPTPPSTSTPWDSKQRTSSVTLCQDFWPKETER